MTESMITFRLELGIKIALAHKDNSKDMYVIMTLPIFVELSTRVLSCTLS